VIEGIVGASAPVERSWSALAWRLTPVIVGVGSLALGMIALGQRSFSSIEATAFVRADVPIRDLLSTIANDQPGQAGHLLLIKVATLAGTDELSLRAPSAIVVALAAALMVLLGTMLLGRAAGLLAGVAFALDAGVVEASREVRPYALGLFGIVAATALFTFALEHGGGWRWVAYGIAAALLPLTHPLAASVLAAHGVALIARRDRTDVRAAGVALVTGTIVAALLLAWMGNERFGAPDGAPTLDLARLAHGIAHPLGWNPILVLAAVAGLVALFMARGADGQWRGALIAALVAAPLLATLLAAVVLPVHAGALILCAPGVALAAGAAAPVLTPVRGLFWCGLVMLVMWSAVATGFRLARAPAEDWRSLAAAVRHVRGPRETVVVVPEGSRAALAYYAPYTRVIRFARGDGAWVVVVADDPDASIEAARPFVRTPTYALLRQFRYGNGLRLQHWVRP